MAVEEKIARLLSAKRHLQELQQLHQALKHVERDLAFAAREADTVLKTEEAAVANLGYRRKAFAEAREALARMERNPGVSFLGLKSPSRLKLEAMHHAMLDYARASDLAFAREALARKTGMRTRAHLAELEARHIDLRRQIAARGHGVCLDGIIEKAQRDFSSAKRTVSESEIDEAVMANHIGLRDAASARTLLRNCHTLDFER